MCGGLRAPKRAYVCVYVCVIGQCHSCDLGCRYRSTMQTYGRAGKAEGGGQSV